MAGGSDDAKPIDWCTSDEFEEYKDNLMRVSELYGIYEMSEKMETKKEELKKNNIDNFYINKYHIDNPQGLRVMIDIIKEHNIVTTY